MSIHLAPCNSSLNLINIFTEQCRTFSTSKLVNCKIHIDNSDIDGFLIHTDNVLKWKTNVHCNMCKVRCDKEYGHGGYLELETATNG